MFDPYHRWLGIPPGQRPPSYYQMLGIAPDERDREVIEAAAVRQSAYVRNFQTGPHARDCARILGELALARATLLDAAKRRRYDAQLPRASTTQPQPGGTTAAAGHLAPTTRPARPSPGRGPTGGAVRSVSPRAKPWRWAAVAGGVLAILVLIGIRLGVRPSPPPQPPEPLPETTARRQPLPRAARPESPGPLATTSAARSQPRPHVPDPEPPGQPLTPQLSPTPTLAELSARAPAASSDVARPPGVTVRAVDPALDPGRKTTYEVTLAPQDARLQVIGDDEGADLAAAGPGRWRVTLAEPDEIRGVLLIASHPGYQDARRLLIPMSRQSHRLSVELAPIPEADGPPPLAENSLGMALGLIPAGEFLMGSPDSDPDAGPDERPQHRVRITRPFYMGIHEVTIEQFRSFASTQQYWTTAMTDGQGNRSIDGKQSLVCWRSSNMMQGDDHPVVLVSWDDAVAFCRWLSRFEGQTYRLPTEAEWEHACRAGTTARRYCGDAADALRRAANVADASLRRLSAPADGAEPWDDGHPSTAPIGRFRPNAFGLYDMLGNAWEWCSDRYDAGAYADATRPAPDPHGPSAGPRRVARGGGFDSRATLARSACRRSWAPDDRGIGLGFRVVRELPPDAAGVPAPPPARPPRPGAAGAGPDPILGKWLSPWGFPAYHEFRPDGAYVYEQAGLKAQGTWRREAGKIVLRTSGAAPHLTIADWLVIQSRDEETLDVLVAGRLPLTWKAVDATMGDRIIGTWRHSADGAAPRELRFRPDGRIDGAEPGASWSFGAQLILQWLPPDRPNSAPDLCLLSHDYRSYRNREDATGPTIRGIKISDAY
jgi:sulfatase modifying factor 1